MHMLTRRTLLAIAPFSVTASAITALAAPSDGKSAPAFASESHKLLALSERLPAVEAAYVSAVAAWNETWATWSPQWPLAPTACCHASSGNEMERDLAGAGLIRDGNTRPWYIKTKAGMEIALETKLAMLERDARRKRPYPRYWRRALQAEIAENERGLLLLPAYLAERDRILRLSNFDAVQKERKRAAAALFDTAREILAEPSRTIKGVKIKAEACAATGRMVSWDRRSEEISGLIQHRDSMVGSLAQALLAVL